MPHPPHHRQTLRLQGYDYSTPGAYFVTVCVNRRMYLLGTVDDGRVNLNGSGEMVHNTWNHVSDLHPCWRTDALVVMPNHLHAVLWRDVSDSDVPLSQVVGHLKSLTTVLYTRGVEQQGWQRFEGRLWQRGYYERVVRNERELQAMQEYIASNPANWERDPDK